MLEESFIVRVGELAGLPSRTDALRSIRAVLISLGERLREDERALLTRELPAVTSRALECCVYRGDFDRDELFARVARHGGTARGFAVERAEIVLRALAERLSEEELRRLKKQVGPSIAELFEVPERSGIIERSRRTAGTTLASGGEGSRHPLSEARGADLAHAESVARSTNPHGATKLSSARGMTQERLDETLATGRPGAERPIAEAGRDGESELGGDEKEMD